jgi:hypothetical protein
VALKFQDPPGTRSRIGRWSYDWTAVLGELKQNPGQWALLNENGPAKASIANAIRAGKISVMRPENGVQVRMANTNRAVSPRTCDVYVRYWPEDDVHLSSEERKSLMKIIGDREKEKV